jgi:hypothetical protein
LKKETIEMEHKIFYVGPIWAEFDPKKTVLSVLSKKQEQQLVEKTINAK